MKSKEFILGILTILIVSVTGCQSVQLSITDLPKWNEHYEARTQEGVGFQGQLLIAAKQSDVRVASTLYSGEKMADIYYPPQFDPSHIKGAVVLVSGDSDEHTKSYCGRSMKDTDQILQWGQVIAESGMIAITYELGNPEFALNEITGWISINGLKWGIDPSKLGFFSISELGCLTGIQTIISNSKKYSGPKPAVSVFYYGMMPLYSSSELYTDVPILTVITEDLWERGIPDSMEKFNKRALEDGAMLKVIDYPEGKFWFDCQSDSPRTIEILEETLAFLKDNL